MADLAASELLLPRRAFTLDIAVRGFGLGAVKDIAELYGASLEATALRVLDLVVEPRLLLIYVGEAGTSADHLTTLRLRLSRRTGKWPPSPSTVVFDRYSPVGRAWRYEPVDEAAARFDLPGPFVSGARVSMRRYGNRLFVLFGR
jgi:hypothetical protein